MQNWPYQALADKARCNFLVCLAGSGEEWTSGQRALVALYVIFGWAVMALVIWTYLFGFLQVRPSAMLLA